MLSFLWQRSHLGSPLIHTEDPPWSRFSPCPTWGQASCCFYAVQAGFWGKLSCATSRWLLGKAIVSHLVTLRGSLAGRAVGDAVPFFCQSFPESGINASRKAILINSNSPSGWCPGHYSAHSALRTWDQFLFFFLFPWTPTLISLSPTDFTAVSVNHCRSSVLNMNRIWGSVSKFSKNQATCLQTWRLHTLVQCRKPAARWPLPTWDGSCSCPSQGASVLLLCGCA